MTTAWSRAVVESIEDATPHIRTVILRPLAGFVSYAPGSHIEIQVETGQRTETRHYSLVGLPVGGRYRIAVKHSPDGLGGSRAMWRLAPGDHVTISQPKNDFALSFGRADYLLIAGGIGITPLLGMALALKQRGASFRLVYAARRQEDLAFAAELDAGLGGAWQSACSAARGRIDVRQLLSTLDAAGEVYVCGPMTLLDAVKAEWSQLGRPLERLRFESFASSGHFAAMPFEVELPRLRLKVSVGAHESMIDALARSGVAVMADCRRGECGLCALPVLSATSPIDHRDVFLSEAERQQNARICACVSRAAGGTIVIDDGYRDRHDIL